MGDVDIKRAERALKEIGWTQAQIDSFEQEAKSYKYFVKAAESAHAEGTSDDLILAVDKALGKIVDKMHRQVEAMKIGERLKAIRLAQALDEEGTIWKNLLAEALKHDVPETVIIAEEKIGVTGRKFVIEKRGKEYWATVMDSDESVLAERKLNPKAESWDEIANDLSKFPPGEGEVSPQLAKKFVKVIKGATIAMFILGAIFTIYELKDPRKSEELITDYGKLLDDSTKSGADAQMLATVWMSKWQSTLEGPFHGMLGYLNYAAAADFGKRMEDILDGMSKTARQELAKKIRDSLKGEGFWKSH